ncbi:hypothetical protein B0H11DRAFT_284588 [Mycena galericulata]|nr:hypothetical protein B0H11DRAFT_284588 [Mycena galericulata]
MPFHSNRCSNRRRNARIRDFRQLHQQGGAVLHWGPQLPHKQPHSTVSPSDLPSLSKPSGGRSLMVRPTTQRSASVTSPHPGASALGMRTRTAWARARRLIIVATSPPAAARPTPPPAPLSTHAMCPPQHHSYARAFFFVFSFSDFLYRSFTVCVGHSIISSSSSFVPLTEPSTPLASNDSIPPLRCLSSFVATTSPSPPPALPPSHSFVLPPPLALTSTRFLSPPAIILRATNSLLSSRQQQRDRPLAREPKARPR